MFSFEREIKQKQADALALENIEHRRKAFAVALRDVVNTAQFVCPNGKITNVDDYLKNFGETTK